MIEATAEDAEQRILAWMQGWFELLANAALGAACAALDDAGANGQRWTPDDLRTVLAAAYLPGTRFRERYPEGPRFTSPAAALGDAHATVSEFDDASGFWAEYDVPLNGEFSDLTAQFSMKWRTGGLAVSLKDLRVL